MRLEVGEIVLELDDHQVADLRRQLAVDVDGDGLVDAAELAARLGVSRPYIYAHARDLGAVRLGGGPKGRLRFDPTKAAAALSKSPAECRTEPISPRRRRRSTTHTKHDLLPIRGEAP